MAKCSDPTRPLNLEPNTRVTLVVTAPDASEPEESFLDTAMSINLDGPADWSESLDRRERVVGPEA